MLLICRHQRPIHRYLFQERLTQPCFVNGGELAALALTQARLVDALTRVDDLICVTALS